LAWLRHARVDIFVNRVEVRVFSLLRRTQTDRRTRQVPTTKSVKHCYRQGTFMGIVLLRGNRIDVFRDIYSKTNDDGV